VSADTDEQVSAEPSGSGLIRHIFVAIALFTPPLIISYLRLRRGDGGRSER
jgi:hypothetical protein